LHVISLVAAALKARPLDAQTAEMVALLDRVSASLNGQLSSLLDISKLDAGLVQPDCERVDVAQFMAQSFESVAPLARAKGLEPVLRVDTRAVVVTDQALLQRMFTNLCQNALKYTSQGRIVLSAHDRGERVVLSVADTGCGIAPADQAHVFHEFVQVGNPERDASQGLGLGLSLVERLARLLDVDVRLASRLGVGTEVSLGLLRAVDGVGVVGVVVEAPAAATAPLDLGMVVLVIDDEATVRQACGMLLDALGCVALLAQDQAEAETLLARQRPDVLLVDLRLRDGINGIDVIRNLRRLLGPVPAVLVSGDTAPERLRMAAEAGIPLCIKPLTAAQLLAELLRIQTQSQGVPLATD
jgi:CheY-like chemotaxis protein